MTKNTINELIKNIKIVFSNFMESLLKKIIINPLKLFNEFKDIKNTKSILKSSYHNNINYIKDIKLPFILYRMLFMAFLYWLFFAQALFMVLTMVIELWQNLQIYLDNSVSMPLVLLITILSVPKWIMLTLPIAIMFGVIMSIASLYQNNELVAIFSSGISIYKLIVPLVLFNFLLSIVMIFANSYAIIPASRLRATLFENITNKTASKNLNRKEITIRGTDGYFWNADEYISSKRELINPLVFKINEDYRITERIAASKAQYTSEGWIFMSGASLIWDASGDIIKEEHFFKKKFNFSDDHNAFKSAMYSIEDMTIVEAKKRIKHLKQLNIKYNKELTEYYKKFSFPFTLLIVSLLAVGVSTISRRNILILALFFAIGLAIIYYIFQMLILDVLAESGAVPPLIGSWLSVVVFIPLAIILIRRAKT